MKKTYICPEAKLNQVHGRYDVLQTNTLANSDNSIQGHWEAKERDGGDMNFVSGSDEGASTGGFGSDAGPWESLW